MRILHNPSWQRWLQQTWRFVRPLVLLYLFVLLAMLLAERWLVYPAPPLNFGDWQPIGLGHEDIWFESADGTRLHGWFVPHAQPRRAILYCHGNGEHIATNADLAVRLRDKLQASVFVFDYRGYGQSAGRPDEAGCIADGLTAQRWLADRIGIHPEEVVLIGRSLGGGVAVALAAEQGAAALVLENTFSSLCDTAACRYPWLPVRWTMDNQYDSVARIRHYSGPLMQCHRTDDSIVPIELARRLFEASPSRVKKWLQFPRLGHNSDWPASYYTTLGGFLDQATATFQSPEAGISVMQHVPNRKAANTRLAAQTGDM